MTMRRILILQTSTEACSTRRPILTRQPARPLTLIGRLGASLILVSSKTRSEMEPLRRRLNNQHPFIVENGGRCSSCMAPFHSRSNRHPLVRDTKSSKSALPMRSFARH